MSPGNLTHSIEAWIMSDILLFNAFDDETVWCLVGNGGMDPYSSIIVPITHSPIPY